MSNLNATELHAEWRELIRRRDDAAIMCAINLSEGHEDRARLEAAEYDRLNAEAAAKAAEADRVAEDEIAALRAKLTGAEQ